MANAVGETTGAVKRIRRWPILAGVGVVVAAATWWVVDAMPPVDDDIVREALPVIDAHLRANTWQGSLTPGSGIGEVRWVCTEKVIETRSDGARTKVGLVASCDEVGKLNGTLVTGSGFRQASVYLVERGEHGYRVLGRELAKDGAAYSPSVKAMFSWLGARRVLDGASPESPEKVAPAAFGLPPDTPVRPWR
jgi:hypothetical protein